MLILSLPPLSRHGILLILDEVQTGFGRTGSMFAADWLDGGVKADILVMAKGIANGFPLSAIGTRGDLSIRQPPGPLLPNLIL
jgi:4-aminobutyrate aminotransferase